MIQKAIVWIFIARAIGDTAAITLTRFKSAYAQSLNPNLTKVHFCYVKAYSRTYASFNLGVEYLRPLSNPFYVKIVAA